MSVVYLHVRATTDWDDERAFRAQLRPELAPKVDAWNRTFDMPYHLFRHRVREIARLNHSRVEGAVQAGWDEIPDGGVVLPVDDDDWFAPDVGRALEAHRDPQASGYLWVSTFIEVPIHLPHRLGLLRRRVFPGTPPRFVCTTNNYAVVKTSGAREVADSHVRASEWVERDPAVRMVRIRGRLSAMNRTLASQTSMARVRPRVTRSQLLRKYRRYRRLYDAPRPELPWARPYLAMMSELMGELGLRQPGRLGRRTRAAAR